MLDQVAVEVDRGPRLAEGGDRVPALEVLGHAVADRVRALPEQLGQHRDVVADQRPLVALERGLDLGHHLGQVDLRHRRPSRAGLGRADHAGPLERGGDAEQHVLAPGAAISCTPIGRPPGSGTGTARTGRPMNEIGWV